MPKLCQNGKNISHLTILTENGPVQFENGGRKLRNKFLLNCEAFRWKKTKIFQTFMDNLPTILQKIFFGEITSKSFFQGFLLIFKFPEDLPKAENFVRKIIAHDFYEKDIFQVLQLSKCSENLETILLSS